MSVRNLKASYVIDLLSYAHKPTFSVKSNQSEGEHLLFVALAEIINPNFSTFLKSVTRRMFHRKYEHVKLILYDYLQGLQELF